MRPDLATILARPIAHRGLHDAGRGAIENSLTAAGAEATGVLPDEHYSKSRTLVKR